MLTTGNPVSIEELSGGQWEIACISGPHETEPQVISDAIDGNCWPLAEDVGPNEAAFIVTILTEEKKCRWFRSNANWAVYDKTRSDCFYRGKDTTPILTRNEAGVIFE